MSLWSRSFWWCGNIRPSKLGHGIIHSMCCVYDHIFFSFSRFLFVSAYFSFSLCLSFLYNITESMSWFSDDIELSVCRHAPNFQFNYTHSARLRFFDGILSCDADPSQKQNQRKINMEAMKIQRKCAPIHIQTHTTTTNNFVYSSVWETKSSVADQTKEIHELKLTYIMAVDMRLNTALTMNLLMLSCG